MKNTLLAFVLMVLAAPSAVFADGALTANEIRQTLDGKLFTVSSRQMAEWSAVWAFDFRAKKSQILSSPRGTATFGLVMKGNQICNSSVPSGPMTQAGFKGCFDVIQNKKSFNFNKGNRRLFVLRLKGVVQ
ncbi:MAG: hypothetical protein GY947_13330 [Rhodobacteraceae bacterium]|nr:hypothetical protein [Paracoccaceae bacterium]